MTRARRANKRTRDGVPIHGAEKRKHGTPSWTDRPCRGPNGELRRRYFPWKPEEADLEFAEEILSETPEHQGLSVWERYCILRAMVCPKGKVDNCKAIPYFVGQVGQALGSGTLKTYLEHVRFWAKERGEPFKGDEYVVWFRYHRAATARYARLKDDAAVPLSNEAAENIIKSVGEVNRAAGVSLYLVTILGVRADTLTKSPRCKFGVTQNEVRFKVSVGKNIKSPGDAHMIREPKTKLPFKPPIGFEEILNSGKPDDLPFSLVVELPS